MHVKPRVFAQPPVRSGVFVRGIVIGDQVQRFVFGGFALHFFQELQPLGMGVALLALPDDLAVQDVERGKPSGGAIALVVVRHRGGTPVLQRKTALQAAGRLNLTFLVAAQNESMFPGAPDTDPRCLRAFPRTAGHARL